MCVKFIPYSPTIAVQASPTEPQAVTLRTKRLSSVDTRV